MEKGGAAAQISEDKKRFFNGMSFIGWEENIIQPKTDPVHQTAQRPDDVKKKKE